MPEEIGPPQPDRFAATERDIEMVDLGAEEDLLTPEQREENERHQRMIASFAGAERDPGDEDDEDENLDSDDADVERDLG